MKQYVVRITTVREVETDAKSSAAACSEVKDADRKLDFGKIKEQFMTATEQRSPAQPAGAPKQP